MYQVFGNGQLLYETNGVTDEVRQIESPAISLVENEGGSFSFTLPKSHMFANTLWRGHKFLLGKNDRVTVVKDGTWLWEGAPSEYNKDIFGNYQITCTGALEYLKDVIMPLNVAVNTYGQSLEDNIRAFTEFVLHYYNARIEELNNRFSLGDNGILHKKIELGGVSCPASVKGPYHFQRIVNFESCFDALQKRILDDFGGEYYITRNANGKLLLNYSMDGRTSFVDKVLVKLGGNILDYNISEDFELYTSVIPLGDPYQEKGSDGARWWWKDNNSAYYDITQRATISGLAHGDSTYGSRVYLSIDGASNIVKKYGFNETVLDLTEVVAKYPGNAGSSTGGWEYYYRQYGVTDWRSLSDYLGESSEWAVYETVENDRDYKSDYQKALLIYARDFLENQQFDKLVLSITASDIHADENVKKDLIFSLGQYLPVSSDLFGRNAKKYKVSEVSAQLDDVESTQIILGGEQHRITKMVK